MSEQGVSPIGTNIARYRKAEGLSASDLAEKVGEGLTRSVIANLESGRKDDVTVRQLLVLALALNVPPAALIVDVLDPWGEGPTPGPSKHSVSMSLYGRWESSGQKALSNSAYFSWVSGQDLKPSSKNTGARKLVADATSTVAAFERTWTLLLSSSMTLRAETNKKEQSEKSAARATLLRDQLLMLCRQLLDWNEQLASSGIDRPNTRAEVQELLFEHGIPFESLYEGLLDG